MENFLRSVNVCMLEVYANELLKEKVHILGKQNSVEKIAYKDRLINYMKENNLLEDEMRLIRWKRLSVCFSYTPYYSFFWYCKYTPYSVYYGKYILCDVSEESYKLFSKFLKVKISSNDIIKKILSYLDYVQLDEDGRKYIKELDAFINHKLIVNSTTVFPKGFNANILHPKKKKGKKRKKK